MAAFTCSEVTVSKHLVGGGGDLLASCLSSLASVQVRAMRLRMKRIYLGEACVIMIAGLTAFAGSCLPRQSRISVALDRLTALRTVNTRANVTTYRGKKAVHLVPSGEQENRKSDSVNTMAVLEDTDFKDGTIDADVAGAPRPGASESARGFVGIAFRLQRDDELITPSTKYVTFINGQRTGRGVRENSSSPTWA
jgi:hypothetical protein